MVERELEPAARVHRPDALLMPAGIDVKDMRDTCGGELSVQQLVLVTKSVVAATDVEREERRPLRKCSAERTDERVRAGPRVARRAD